MKYIVLDDRYDRELGSHRMGKSTYTILCDTYEEAYDKYTECIDEHIAQAIHVKMEQTFRIHSGSCARCEFSNGLVTSILFWCQEVHSTIKHPKMGAQL